MIGLAALGVSCALCEVRRILVEARVGAGNGAGEGDRLRLLRELGLASKLEVLRVAVVDLDGMFLADAGL